MRDLSSVESVRAFALENYEVGGDAIVECWDDNDIQEYIDAGCTEIDWLTQFAFLASVEEDQRGYYD